MSPRAAEIQRLLDEGLTQTEVAEIISVTPQRVSQIVKADGLTVHRRRARKDKAERNAAIVARVAAGESYAAVAASMGVRYAAVTMICSSAGIKQDRALVRLNCSAAQRGRVISQEHRERISAALRDKKRPPRSPEWSAKIGAGVQRMAAK